MKKKLVIIIMLLCSLIIVGCTNKKENSSSTNKVEKTDNGYMIDGARIKEIDIISVGKIFNFSIVFDNSNNKEVEFYTSQVLVKKGNKKNNGHYC